MCAGQSVCAGQVWRAAPAGWGQVLVVRPLRVPAGHVPLLRQLGGDGEGGGGGGLGAPLAGGSTQLVGRAVPAPRHAPPHQGAGGHTAYCFRAPANQRAGGDGGWVSAQRGAALAQASLQGGAGRRVGGHGAVQRVGAPGDRVDPHDADLGPLRGPGSVGVGGRGMRGAIGRTNPPSTDEKNT